MKPPRDILQKIHSWPEEGRIILAVILFLISAVAVGFLWNINVTASLEKNNAAAAKNSANETMPVFSPTATIYESFKSLGKFFNF